MQHDPLRALSSSSVGPDEMLFQIHSTSRPKVWDCIINTTNEITATYIQG
jgi:hypothetical protein